MIHGASILGDVQATFLPYWRDAAASATLTLENLLIVAEWGPGASHTHYSNHLNLVLAVDCAALGDTPTFGLTTVACDIDTSRCQGTAALPEESVISAYSNPLRLCISTAAGVSYVNTAAVVSAIEVDSVGGVSPGGWFALLSTAMPSVVVTGNHLSAAASHLAFAFKTVDPELRECPPSGSDCSDVTQLTAMMEPTGTGEVTVKIIDWHLAGTDRVSYFCTCMFINPDVNKEVGPSEVWRHTGVGAVVLPISSIGGAPSGSVLGGVVGSTPPTPLIAEVNDSAWVAGAPSGEWWLSVRSTVEATTNRDLCKFPEVGSVRYG
eukprot:Hpha_TRINITY_DN8158_c0_g2::TRINITY_DN8158_c0_g2_i1::g.171986::m.171986